MASTEISNITTPVGVQPVIASVQSTYVSGTWSFVLPVSGTARVGAYTAMVTTTAGLQKLVTVTFVPATNTMTIATSLVAGDVANVIYTLTN